MKSLDTVIAWFHTHMLRFSWGGENLPALARIPHTSPGPQAYTATEGKRTFLAVSLDNSKEISSQELLVVAVFPPASSPEEQSYRCHHLREKKHSLSSPWLPYYPGSGGVSLPIAFY